MSVWVIRSDSFNLRKHSLGVTSYNGDNRRKIIWICKGTFARRKTKFIYFLSFRAIRGRKCAYWMKKKKWEQNEKKKLKGNGADTKSAMSVEDLIESHMDQKVLDWAYGYSMFSVSLWDESLSVKKAKIVFFLVIFEQRKDNKFCRVKELRIEVLMPLMMGVFKWLSKTAASSLLVLELENRHKPGNCARSKIRRFFKVKVYLSFLTRSRL